MHAFLFPGNSFHTKSSELLLLALVMCVFLYPVYATLEVACWGF